MSPLIINRKKIFLRNNKRHPGDKFYSGPMIKDIL